MVFMFHCTNLVSLFQKQGGLPGTDHLRPCGTLVTYSSLAQDLDLVAGVPETGWGCNPDSGSKQASQCPWGLNPYCRFQPNPAHSQMMVFQDTKWDFEFRSLGENILPLVISMPTLCKDNVNSKGSQRVEGSTVL